MHDDRRHALLSTALLCSLLLVAGCSSMPAAESVGDAVNGEKLFSGEIAIADGNAPSCAMCHAVQPGETLALGPNLSNIGNRANATIPGMSAQAYLRASIIDPDTYLAGGFQEGIHYRGYEQALTLQQLNDLMAYMLTLTSGDNR